MELLPILLVVILALMGVAFAKGRPADVKTSDRVAQGCAFMVFFPIVIVVLSAVITGLRDKY